MNSTKCKKAMFPCGKVGWKRLKEQPVVKQSGTSKTHQPQPFTSSRLG